MTALFELAARLQSASAAEGMLWMIVKATLILLIARVLLAAMPRAAAATKHLVATAALVGVAAMPLVTVFAPAWELSVKPAQKVESAPAQPAAKPEAESRTIGFTDAEEPIATAISVAKATGIADKPFSLLERSRKVVSSTWKGLIVVSIGLVSLLLLGHMLLGMLGVWFVSRQAQELTNDVALQELDSARDQLQLPYDVRLLKTPRVAVPVIWGITRPVLLLPADVDTWPAERLRVVLLHELAHLKRWDGVSLILTRIAVSLFWFHPLAWSLERAGRSECERACDDLVLAGGTKPSEYADHLLAIARSMPAFDPFRSVTLAMSRKSQLEGRLLSILHKDVARRVFSGRGVAIACALALAAIVPVSALRLIAKPSEEKNAKPVIKEEAIKTDSEVTVKPDVESIGDYFFAKLGKFDKRADRFLREPRNAEERYERAYDLYHNERYAEAAALFRRAGEEDYSPAKSYYNAACSWALLGDADKALAELDLAIKAGWDDFEHIAEDSDFDPIRDDRRFAAMLQSRQADVATRRVTKVVEKFEELRDQKDVANPHDRHHKKEWFGLGLDLLRLRKLDESIEAFQRSIAAGENVSSAMYNIACAYSYKQDARNGMAWLDKAIEQGFSGREKMENDPDVAFLRRQPGFEALQQKSEDLELKGCCRGPAGLFYDNWAESVEHHQAMVKKHPTSGRAWFNLGFTTLQARQFPAALDAFRRAIEMEYRVGTSSYNMACAHALAGHRDLAFEWLDRAEKAGFDVAEHADDDEDLHSLHRDPRWKALVASAD